MVNPRRRTAATLGCCLAVTVAAASHDNMRHHTNGGTVHHGMITRSNATRRRRESTRRLGVIHQKGHSFTDAEEQEDVIISSASIPEEQPDEQDKDASSSSLLPFLMLGTSTQTTTTILSPPPEEPATSLSPYSALQILRIGGSASTATRDPTRYPYMASLQIEGASPNAGKFDYHMCTGFLIAPDLVMTAAHCAEYTPPGSDETYQAFNGIEVGRINLSEEVPYDAFESSTYRLNYENLIPERVVKHPKYDAATLEHDVMIVKVFGKSRFSPVRIDSDGVDAGQELTVLGWGAQDAASSKKYSDDLREADLLVMNNDDCRSTSVRITDPETGATSEATLADNIFDDMVCAAAQNRYVCYGDGGGPAVLRGDSPSQDAVAAVVSFGYGCVDPDYPAVMIRTADHFNWIRTVVCKESTDPPEQYACPGGEDMAMNSAAAAETPKQTVTLKLKLDMMAVETGFVILTSPVPRVVAQRTPGYYKIRENQIVLERMELPSNQCYKLVLLDSFGDGFCCDLGGGSGTLYLGTDTGFYTGRALVEVHGKFKYDASGEFCLDSSMTSSSSSSEGGSTAVMPSGGSAASSSSNGGSANSGGGSADIDGVANSGSGGGSAGVDGSSNTDGSTGTSDGSTGGSTGTSDSSTGGSPGTGDGSTGGLTGTSDGFTDGSTGTSDGSTNGSTGTSDGSTDEVNGTGDGSTDGSTGTGDGSTDEATGTSDGSTDGSTTTSNNGSTISSGGSADSSNGSTNNDTNSNQGEGTSGWTGPAMSPEFEYCNQFCNANPNALNCGSYTCYHSDDATSDSQENGSSGGSGSSGGTTSGSGSSGGTSSGNGSGGDLSSGNGGEEGSTEEDGDSTPSPVPFDLEGHAADPAEYHLTVQFQFDDNPQDVSWVLYDLTENKVKMFVDFDVYKQEDFANQMLEVVANVDGPEAGEKKYAFTVYDKASDGLCCEHGEGYYKLFLGDVDDNLELLGDSEYEFSSSYYFTLFEEGNNMTANGAEVEGMEEEAASTDAPIATSVPTTSPVSDPTAGPSLSPNLPPSKTPTESPTLSPTNAPTTPRPTFPWEVKRSELMDEIGARWNTASVTPPDGKFNDLGGDQRNFDFTVGSRSMSGGRGLRIWFGFTALVSACIFSLL